MKPICLLIIALLLSACDLPQSRGFAEATATLAVNGGPPGDGTLEVLSPRELEVLALMAEGRTNAGIARALVVTGGAVEKHISNIFSKLDLPASDDDHRRVLAVLAFLRAGSG